MASKKNIKKNVDYLFGELIDECYIWMLVNSDKETGKAAEIVDEIMKYYDELRPKLNGKKVENPKKYYSELIVSAENKANEFVERINSL